MTEFNAWLTMHMAGAGVGQSLVAVGHDFIVNRLHFWLAAAWVALAHCRPKPSGPRAWWQPCQA